MQRCLFYGGFKSQQQEKKSDKSFVCFPGCACFLPTNQLLSLGVTPQLPVMLLLKPPLTEKHGKQISIPSPAAETFQGHPRNPIYFHRSYASRLSLTEAG
jgi:hypothetical protein